MKVKAGGCFFYPDLMVDCKNADGDRDYRESPLIIMEVLSKNTRKIDHRLKRLAYQNLPSLQEYVQIEQDFVDIEICRRSNRWQSEHFYLGEEIYLAAIDLRVSVETIYSRVDNEDVRAFFAGREVSINV